MTSLNTVLVSEKHLKYKTELNKHPSRGISFAYNSSPGHTRQLALWSTPDSYLVSLQ